MLKNEKNYRETPPKFDDYYYYTNEGNNEIPQAQKLQQKKIHTPKQKVDTKAEEWQSMPFLAAPLGNFAVS